MHGQFPKPPRRDVLYKGGYRNFRNFRKRYLFHPPKNLTTFILVISLKFSKKTFFSRQPRISPKEPRECGGRTYGATHGEPRQLFGPEWLVKHKEISKWGNMAILAPFWIRPWCY